LITLLKRFQKKKILFERKGAPLLSQSRNFSIYIAREGGVLGCRFRKDASE